MWIHVNKASCTSDDVSDLLYGDHGLGLKVGEVGGQEGQSLQQESPLVIVPAVIHTHTHELVIDDNYYILR